MKLRDRRRSLGARGERDAVRLLVRQGYRLLARNWKVKAGELDIVALDGEEVVFVEVKSRRVKPPGARFDGASNLSHRQMRRNFAAAKFYRKVFRCAGLAGRFDLIEIEYDKWRRIRFAHHYYDYLPPLPPGS